MPSFNFRKSKQSSNTKFYKQFYKFCNIFQIPVYQSDFLINWKKKKEIQKDNTNVIILQVLYLVLC